MLLEISTQQKTLWRAYIQKVSQYSGTRHRWEEDLLFTQEAMSPYLFNRYRNQTTTNRNTN